MKVADKLKGYILGKRFFEMVHNPSMEGSRRAGGRIMQCAS